MPYITTVNKQSHTIDIGDPDTHGQPGSLSLDGVTYAIDWRQLAMLETAVRGERHAGGRYSLIIAGRSYELFARALPGENGGRLYEIQFAGRRFEVRVEDQRERMLAGLARTNSGSDEARITSPMPGLVLTILQEEGATVEQGQPVVVLEAMKMENDLPAPISGTIKEIRVRKGQTVDQGAVLVVIAAAGAQPAQETV